MLHESEDDILEAGLRRACERMTSVAERLSARTRASAARLDEDVGRFAAQMTSVHLGERTPLESLPFDIWLDCNGPRFERQYGPGWRDKLEVAAKKAYGEDWKAQLTLRHSVANTRT